MGLLNNKKAMLSTAVAGLMAMMPALASADATLSIESWRNDDLEIWSDQIIPAFNKDHPEIAVKFDPSPPADYNASLNARLAGGTAGDLITCRPFDASLELYNQGNLSPLNDVSGLSSFSDVAKSAWTTDDGATTFCMPMASVIHGFIYNMEIFDELGIEVPKTRAEFMAAVKKIKDESKYTPIAFGTADQWEAATMGFQNVGPNFWKGEEGRKALIDGSGKYTDQAYVDTFKHLAEWSPYMGKGYTAQKYPDTQNLFTLGRAAIYPAGSWDIATFNSQADFKFGAFPAPVGAAGDTCYISDHTDIGLGINANSKNQEAAKVFLNWMATSEFANLFANALPGFFPLSDAKVEISDPVASEFVSWRGKCESTIRNSYQILSRGTPNLETELWSVSAQVLNGTMSAEDAATQAEAGLAKWYQPHM